MRKDLEDICICKYVGCDPEHPRWDCECDHHWVQYIPARLTTPAPDLDVVRYCNDIPWNGSMGGYGKLWVCPACFATTTPKHYAGHMEWHKRTETL